MCIFATMHNVAKLSYPSVMKGKALEVIVNAIQNKKAHNIKITCSQTFIKIPLDFLSYLPPLDYQHHCSP